MIRLENIKKSFSGREVLKGIDAIFEQGKPNLIIGGSGTGKSVLLKCIVGLIQPDDGFVYYNHTEFTFAPRNDKTEIRRQIGMLFQGGALFDSKTVEQNVMFPLDILTDMGSAEKLDRVNFCLERVGLAGQNKKLPSEISGGMQKRVGIARAIVNNSKFLFCDEPNSGLDPLTSITIDDLIMEITEEFKITTVVVTHDMNSLLGIGENIIFLHEGNKLWEGNKDDITQSGVKEFEDFVFASKVMAKLRK